MDEPGVDDPLAEQVNPTDMTLEDFGPEAASDTAEITRSKCQVVWEASESNPNLRPDAEGKGLMKGKEPMHVPEWFLNETGKERFSITPRDPQELEEFDSSMGDDTVKDNTAGKVPRPQGGQNRLQMDRPVPEVRGNGTKREVEIIDVRIWGPAQNGPREEEGLGLVSRHLVP